MCSNGNHPLHGKTLKASVFAAEPLLFLDKDAIKGGVLIEMFKALGQYLEFNHEILLRRNWFIFYPNRTVGDSLGDVKHE